MNRNHLFSNLFKVSIALFISIAYSCDNNTPQNDTWPVLDDYQKITFITEPSKNNQGKIEGNIIGCGYDTGVTIGNVTLYYPGTGHRKQNQLVTLHYGVLDLVLS
jgi:hypothetical protein